MSRPHRPRTKFSRNGLDLGCASQSSMPAILIKPIVDVSTRTHLDEALPSGALIEVWVVSSARERVNVWWDGSWFSL